MTTLEVTKFLNSYRFTPFEWGVSDCATFILKYLLDTTGKDYSHLANFSWRSKSEAIRFVKKGGRGINCILQEGVEAEVVQSISQVKTGDLVIISQEGWETAGVYLNGSVVWFGENVGLNLSKLSEVDTIINILRVK